MIGKFDKCPGKVGNVRIYASHPALSRSRVQRARGGGLATPYGDLLRGGYAGRLNAPALAAWVKAYHPPGLTFSTGEPAPSLLSRMATVLSLGIGAATSTQLLIPIDALALRNLRSIVLLHQSVFPEWGHL